MVTYLVSGSSDILPAHQNVKGKGVKVKHAEEVNPVASHELDRSVKYIVIAHGDEEGSVYWQDTNEVESRKWLYVGMSPAPSRVTMYLHSCKVGICLPQFLIRCNVVAPLNSVPMPTGQDSQVVLQFLRKVERILHMPNFSVAKANEKIGEFINLKLRTAAARGSDREIGLWLILRAAFGFFDDSEI